MPSFWVPWYFQFPGVQMIQAEPGAMLMCHHINGMESRDGLERDCTFAASVCAAIRA